MLWRRDRLPTPVFLGFPGGSAGKESAHNAGDLGSIPGFGKSSVFCSILQYSTLETSMDYIVSGVAKSQTGLSDFHFQGAQEVTEIQSQQEVRASCHSS